jgi:hypothetical protein
MRTSAPMTRNVASSSLGFSVMAKSKSFAVHLNPFNPRPKTLPHGDPDPHKLLSAVGNAMGAWEMAEVSYSYLFNTLVRPKSTSIAIRRSYGSIASAKGRSSMVEAAAEAFFHAFPNKTLEAETQEFITLYNDASGRRNDIAHGVIYTALAPLTGYYLEANDYNNKRSITRQSPYAYTGTQVIKIAKDFTRLRMDVEAFRRTLKAHFQSADPKTREQY